MVLEENNKNYHYKKKKILFIFQKHVNRSITKLSLKKIKSIAMLLGV